MSQVTRLHLKSERCLLLLYTFFFQRTIAYEQRVSILGKQFRMYLINLSTNFLPDKVTSNVVKIKNILASGPDLLVFFSTITNKYNNLEVQ